MVVGVSLWLNPSVFYERLTVAIFDIGIIFLALYWRNSYLRESYLRESEDE